MGARKASRRKRSDPGSRKVARADTRERFIGFEPGGVPRYVDKRRRRHFAAGASLDISTAIPFAVPQDE